MSNESTLTHWYVTLDGADVTGLMESARAIEVDQNLLLPDMCSITLNDGTRWSDDARIGLGHTIEVNAHAGQGNQAPAGELFSGDLVSLDGDFQPSGHTLLIIRAYDRSHRLQRGSAIRSWTSVSDSDIARRIGSEHGLSVEVDQTDTVYESLIQDNVSDFTFLRERARVSGRVMAVVGNTLHFKEFERFATSAVELDLGRNLLEFRPRISASGQVTRVETKGWDPKAKRAILGRANSGSSMAERSEWGQRGVELYRASSGTPAPALFVTDSPLTDQGQADALAAARLHELWSGDFRAEGVALGDPRLRAGARVEIQNQGKFNGEYIVTTARHTYEGGHYLVHFKIAGLRAETMADLVAPSEPAFSHPATGRTSYGATVAIVTNNRDPDNLGRVKVKFPWLDDSMESGWARWLSPMAGPGRGFFCLPEVNDEVLVTFEHGDFNRPLVLGALWNGSDATPETVDEAVASSGKVNHRLLKTRAGHIIRFDDTVGAEKIEIIDKTGNNSIVIESSSNKVTLTTVGDIELKATQNMKLSALSVEIKGTQGVKIDGMSVDISGSATTTVKGGVVQIN